VGRPQLVSGCCPTGLFGFLLVEVCCDPTVFLLPVGCTAVGRSSYYPVTAKSGCHVISVTAAFMSPGTLSPPRAGVRRVQAFMWPRYFLLLLYSVTEVSFSSWAGSRHLGITITGVSCYRGIPVTAAFTSPRHFCHRGITVTLDCCVRSLGYPGISVTRTGGGVCPVMGCDGDGNAGPRQS